MQRCDQDLLFIQYVKMLKEIGSIFLIIYIQFEIVKLKEFEIVEEEWSPKNWV